MSSPQKCITLSAGIHAVLAGLLWITVIAWVPSLPFETEGKWPILLGPMLVLTALPESIIVFAMMIAVSVALLAAVLRFRRAEVRIALFGLYFLFWLLCGAMIFTIPV